MCFPLRKALAWLCRRFFVRAGEENERAALELAAEGVGICRFVHGGMEDGLRGARGMAGEGSAWILWVYGRGGLTMGGRALYREEGWIDAALPEPGKGRCGGAGWRCLPRWGKGALGGRAPVWAMACWLAEGAFLRARGSGSGARERWAGHIVSSVSARFAIRRGYGGPCPHPLKDHWPLRIPFAAAQNSWLHNESRAIPAQRLFDVWMD